MGEIVLIATAICRTADCEENGIPNVYEQESGVDFFVHCGQCQNQIGDITLSEKD
jgi:hypothetical protein